MNMMPFPLLSEGTLQRVNLIGAWLARNDFAAAPAAGDAELIVLAGNAVLPTVDAAARLAKESGLPLLITGGLGHSTTFLYAAVAQHPRYNHLRTTGLTEAGILARIAREFHEVPEEQIIVEEKSTNCGENARFTRELLDARGELPARAVLIQDPT
ncbi:YdcF family protein, partial [Cronobacter sakazakii]|nr:YdcF family protein [Cronobacter sakazakii]